MTRALVLLSGGQDSTTALFWARREYDEVHALTVIYGQRHRAEVGAARAIAELARVASHSEIAVPIGALGVESALLEPGRVLKASGGLVDHAMPEGLPNSYVPGRNLLFLTLAVQRAAVVGAGAVVAGVCETDFSGYPDCREVFVDAFAEAANLALPSSLRPISVETPLMHRSKAETVALARELGDDAWAALGLSVTCYEGKRPGCGRCPACELRAKGFREAGEVDPAEVEVER